MNMVSTHSPCNLPHFHFLPMFCKYYGLLVHFHGINPSNVEDFRGTSNAFRDSVMLIYLFVSKMFNNTKLLLDHRIFQFTSLWLGPGIRLDLGLDLGVH